MQMTNGMLWGVFGAHWYLFDGHQEFADFQAACYSLFRRGVLIS